MITPVCFSPICKNVLYIFIVIEYDKMPTHFLSTWGLETKEQIKLAKYKIRFDL